jgi:hypothetical protein
MNFSKKLVICVAFLCVASFAQQTATKSTTPKTTASVTVVNSDKKVGAVIKPPANTWTKIKDLFM